MRKVVVQQFVTLDGFAAGPNGELDFVTETGAAADPTSGPFVEKQLAFIESLDTILLGAVTYRMFAEYWPEQTTETQRIADALNATPKVVFSSTLTEPLAWPNTQLVSRDPVEAVREMKDNGTTSMRTLGSLTLCRSLLKAGLVDRFRVVVFPVITGSTGQDRIYDGYPDVALDMVASRTFDGRIQLLEYVPTLLAGPPGTTKADA